LRANDVEDVFVVDMRQGIGGKKQNVRVNFGPKMLT